MIALIDYGAGNLTSVRKALAAVGVDYMTPASPDECAGAAGLIVPGVGNFGAAAIRLAAFAPALRAALATGHPCLGICLGMQLLYETSEEGEGAGLAALRGRVRKLKARRVPHMGWNDVTAAHADPLLHGIDSMLGYYANSFVAEPADEASVVAWTEYDDERIPAIVRRDRTWGVQFHPEKSGDDGLQLIRNFLAAIQS